LRPAGLRAVQAVLPPQCPGHAAPAAPGGWSGASPAAAAGLAEPERLRPAGSSPGHHDAPAWFDADSFLKGAEEHFYTLQRHWRDNDVAGMAEYLDPALLQQMLAERSANPPSSNGFVEQLEARLEGIEQREGRTIA